MCDYTDIFAKPSIEPAYTARMGEGDVKKVQTAKKRKNIENTMVSMLVNISTKERKTQIMSFSVKFSFLLQTEPRRGEMRP